MSLVENRFIYKKLTPPIIGDFGERYKYRMLENYKIATGIIPSEPIDLEFLALDLAGILTLKLGFLWNGASGPAIDTANFIRGSGVHDGLYRLMQFGLLLLRWRKRADKLLRKICREEGMKKIRRWWVYRFVRTFARHTAKPKRRGQMKRMILIMVILFTATGCMATVHQKAIALAEKGESIYTIVRRETIRWHQKFSAVRDEFVEMCAAETLSDRDCKRLQSVKEKAEAAWGEAKRLDATAAEIGLAKNKIIDALAEIQKAIDAVGTGEPAPGPG